MTANHFPLPATVELTMAKGLVEDLVKHIRSSTAPSVTTDDLRQGGVPLLQILVAARTYAAGQGKPFTVQAQRDGAFARLLATCGLDPVLCGAPADLVPSLAAASSTRN